MAQAGIGYAIPGLRHTVAVLRNVGWWSQATAQAELVRQPVRPEIRR